MASRNNRRPHKILAAAVIFAVLMTSLWAAAEPAAAQSYGEYLSNEDIDLAAANTYPFSIEIAALKPTS